MLLPSVLSLLLPSQTLAPAPTHSVAASRASSTQLVVPSRTLQKRPRSPEVVAVLADSGGIEFAFDDEDDEEEDDPGEIMEGILTDKAATNLTVSELQTQLKMLGQKNDDDTTTTLNGNTVGAKS